MLKILQNLFNVMHESHTAKVQTTLKEKKKKIFCTKCKNSLNYRQCSSFQFILFSSFFYILYYDPVIFPPSPKENEIK